MTELTGQASEAGTIDRLMAGWVADVETPDACAAHLLCDRWPADAVAFRFVAEDMSAVDLTFGELADRSRRLATGLAARGVTRGDRRHGSPTRRVGCGRHGRVATRAAARHHRDRDGESAQF